MPITSYIKTSALLMGLALVPQIVMAADPDPAPGADFGTFSANIAITTDYRFRGISQSMKDPAVQGGFDWTKSIFYAGIWASSIDFGGLDGAGEFDLYAGIAPTFMGINFKLGGIAYLYPGARDPKPGEFDYFEVAASAEHNFGSFTTGLALNWSPDYFADSGDAVFLEGKVSVPLLDNVSLSAALGHQWISNNARFGAPDYLTWNIGASYTWKQFTIDARYVDTDLNRTQCFGGPGKLCGATAIATLSASF